MEETERADKGFGSSGLGMEVNKVQPMICFLHAHGNHKFYDSFHISQHLVLCKGQDLLLNAVIVKANLRKFEEDFLTSVKEMAKEDENCT